MILPVDHLAMEIKTTKVLPLSMIQLKNVVADLTGLILVHVYQPQKKVEILRDLD